MKWQHAFDCFDHVAAAGMGEDLIGIGGALFVKLGDSGGRDAGDGAVELVLQLAGGIDEADFLAFFGLVDGGEIFRKPIAGISLAGPDRGRCAIAENAEADEDTGIVIDVKRGGANFHGDDGDGGVWIRREKSLRGAQRGNGGTATEADEIDEISIGAKADFFRDMAGDARAEVAGAGAEEQRVERGNVEVGGDEGFFEGGDGEFRRFAFVIFVELLRVAGEERFDGIDGEVAFRNAGEAAC